MGWCPPWSSGCRGPAWSRARVLSRFICVRFFVAMWIVVCSAPLSVRFSRQEYWGRLPCPPPRDLPYPGIKPTSLASPALFTTCAPWEAPSLVHSPTEQLASQERNPSSPNSLPFAGTPKLQVFNLHQAVGGECGTLMLLATRTSAEDLVTVCSGHEQRRRCFLGGGLS